MKNKRSIKYILIALLACILFLYWNNSEENSNDILFSVEKGDIQKTVTATGTLQALEQVDIGAQVSGQIKSILVQEGQRVKQGDLLALIDPRIAETDLRLSKAELLNAQANLQVKQLALQQAQREWERQSKLYRNQATAKKDLDDAKFRLETAKVEIKIAQSNVDSATVKVDKNQTELGYTEIRAPFDAIVISVIAKSGQTLATSQQVPVLMKLANIDTMKVNTKISEADVNYVQSGAPVSFTLLGEPHNRLYATLDAVKLAPTNINDQNNENLSNNAVYYYATFTVPNPAHKLRIAMTVAVTILLDKRENVLTLPLSALGTMIAQDQYYVTVIRKNGEREQITVKTGLKDDAKVEILEGLTEGDMVVLPVSSVSIINEEDIYGLGL